MQVSDGNQVWASVASHLRTQLTEAVWFSTFTDVRPIKVDERELTVTVPSNQVRDRILNRYLPIVTEALEQVIESPGCTLTVLVDPTHAHDGLGAELSHVASTPESSGRPGPIMPCHQPGLPVMGWGSAANWSPVRA